MKVVVIINETIREEWSVPVSNAQSAINKVMPTIKRLVENKVYNSIRIEEVY